MCLWMSVMVVCHLILCFFKHKTAYEMLISDWSSDVCSSDLLALHIGARKTIMLLLDLAFQQIAELLQALKTKRFREFIVRAAFCRHLDLSDLQIESRGLALQIFGIVILGESDFDRLFLASLRSEERRVGKECVRTVRSR